jgi:hypothetical protein
VLLFAPIERTFLESTRPNKIDLVDRILVQFKVGIPETVKISWFAQLE